MILFLFKWLHPQKIMFLVYGFLDYTKEHPLLKDELLSKKTWKINRSSKEKRKKICKNLFDSCVQNMIYNGYLQT